jgi:hypothetical protein
MGIQEPRPQPILLPNVPRPTNVFGTGNTQPPIANGNGTLALRPQNYSGPGPQNVGPGNGGLQAPAGPQAPEVKQSFMKMARALAHMSGNIILPTSGEEDFESFHIQLPDGPLLPINVGKLAERAPTLSALVLTFLASRLMQIQLKAADPNAHDLGETIKQQLTDFATTYKAFVQKLVNPSDILDAADVMATNSATNASKAVVAAPAYIGYKQYLYAPTVPGRQHPIVTLPGLGNVTQPVDATKYHTFSITREFWNKMMEAQAQEAQAAGDSLNDKQLQDRLLTRLAERFGAYVTIPVGQTQQPLTVYVPQAFYTKNAQSIQPKSLLALKNANVKIMPFAFSSGAVVALPATLDNKTPPATATAIEEVLSPKASHRPPPLTLPNANAFPNSPRPGPSSAPGNMQPFGSIPGSPPNSRNQLFDLNGNTHLLSPSRQGSQGWPLQMSPMGSPGTPGSLFDMPIGPPTSGPMVPYGQGQQGWQGNPGSAKFRIPEGYSRRNSGRLPPDTLEYSQGPSQGPSRLGSLGSMTYPEYNANAGPFGGGKKKAAKKPVKAKKSTETKKKPAKK